MKHWQQVPGPITMAWFGRWVAKSSSYCDIIQLIPSLFKLWLALHSLRLPEKSEPRQDKRRLAVAYPVVQSRRQRSATGAPPWRGDRPSRRSNGRLSVYTPLSSMNYAAFSRMGSATRNEGSSRVRMVWIEGTPSPSRLWSAWFIVSREWTLRSQAQHWG